MKRILTIIMLIGLAVGLASAQNTSKIKSNLTIEKSAPMLYLNGTSAGIDFYNGDVTLQQSSNTLTLGGGNFSLGTNSLLGTGSIGATGTRLLKGWFTDLEITNLPTVNGIAFKTALTLTAADVGLGNVTNESKATMFSSPSFTGSSTFSGSLLPSSSATYYFGSNDNRWNGIYFSNSAFMNWANNISISGINDRLEFIAGDLDLNNNNLYSTGDIGTDLSRVNHLYVDSLFSNYSDIILTGYAPLNNPTFTGTVTMPNVNLPGGTSAFLDGNINSYINFAEFQIDINAHVDLGDYDLWANYIGDETDRVEGGYFGFVAADTVITQSVGVADSVVAYGFFDNLSINNRPTVGAASLLLAADLKTINGNSIVGSGDLTIVGGASFAADSLTVDSLGYSIYNDGEAIPPNIPDAYTDDPYDLFPEIHAFAGDTSNYPVPDKIGNLFINTSTSKVYVSVSTSRGGWVILNLLLPLFYFVIKRRRK